MVESPRNRIWRWAIVATLAGAAAGTVGGCGTVHRLDGTYAGMRPYQVAPGQDDVAIRQLATVTLTVKPDGNADLSDGGVPVEGHIDYGTNTAKFVPDAIANVGVYKQPKQIVDKFTVELKRQDDDHLVYDGLVLTRKHAMTQPASG